MIGPLHGPMPHQAVSALGLPSSKRVRLVQGRTGHLV